MAAPESVAFYTTADGSYFVGLVALVNSLRLVGHEEPVLVLDCGLEPWQREALKGQVTLVPAPRDAIPGLLKHHAPLAHPADVMVHIDSDIVVIRRLDELIERCWFEQQIVVYAFPPPDRFDPSWREVLDLPELRQGESYVSSGFLLLPGELGTGVLEALARGQERIASRAEPSYFDDREAAERGEGLRGVEEDPFYYPDQDVLNAILLSVVPPERQHRLAYEAVAEFPFAGTRVVDRAGLRCENAAGTRPYLLHHLWMKPWLGRAPHNAYTQLLPRLLLESDLAVRLGEGDVPVRFRRGLSGRVERGSISVETATSALRERLRPRRRWRQLRRTLRSDP